MYRWRALGSGTALCVVLASACTGDGPTLAVPEPDESEAETLSKTDVGEEGESSESEAGTKGSSGESSGGTAGPDSGSEGGPVPPGCDEARFEFASAPPFEVRIIMDRSLPAGATLVDHDADSSTPTILAADWAESLVRELLQLKTQGGACTDNYFLSVQDMSAPTSDSCGGTPEAYRIEGAAGLDAYLAGLPPPGGGRWPTSALTGAMAEAWPPGEPAGPDIPEYVLLLSGPAACADDDPELPDASFAALLGDVAFQTGNVQIAVTGPWQDANLTPTDPNDAQPDGHNAGDYFDDLRDRFGSYFVSRADVTTIASHLERFAPPVSCELSLAQPPNVAPSHPELLNFVYINGIGYPKLDVNWQACSAGTVDGWIWVGEPGQTLFLCGAACQATRCDARESGENLVIEMPYSCPDP